MGIMAATEGSRKAVGNNAEGVASRYLERQGVKIIARNVYSKGGELDLVGMDSDVLVFFEVRFRGASSFSTGAESIGYTKQRRLVRAASFYLHRHGLWNLQSRIDVISIAPGTVKQYRIQWIKNAIQASP